MPRLRVIVAALLAVGTLPPLAWWLLGPRGEAVELVARQWRTELEVERLRQESGTDWCDELPPGATVLSRRRMNDPSGQRPGEAERCQYSLLAWRLLWVAHREGRVSSAPQWPQPPLSPLPVGEPGAERTGHRAVFYELLLRNRSGQTWTCRADAARWQAYREGQRLRLPIDRWGVAHCGDLS
ncbi:MAG: hypothetical protein DI603_06590 [Roseateles depolymerans]|uniref:Uncharacterized protein n=1 Tax=Roseateles depolymerans TaxID=76731 RepID=A0A2W5DVD3_9BURK|nr:MAG: hypothetical protein DI603_06590 [Roseateles depolymerans]